MWAIDLVNYVNMAFVFVEFLPFCWGDSHSTSNHQERPTNSGK